MIVTEDPQHFRNLLDKARQGGQVVGLHPTMGALHGGHKANIRRAAAECGAVAVTIFVNPLQFGPDEDFEAYPRPIEADLAVADEAGAAVVFHPRPGGMFSAPPLTSVRVEGISQRWEGAFRPAHFQGVATIVTKLLSLAGPCYAYFGEKDYQQLAVVRRLVEDLSLPAAVVGCTTVREPDGLALSSRNAYLSDEERRAASCLYWALLAGKRAVEDEGATSGDAVRRAMAQVLDGQRVFRADYADIVDPVTLDPLTVVAGPARLLIAARCPSARLIDNLAVNEED